MARNAFNLIVSAVAAAATFAFTGSFQLAAAVFSLGNIALNIFNRSTPSSDLSDLRANKSSYGEPIPIIYNEYRVSGHLVWASEVRAKERGHGGFDYGQDLRWVLAERPQLEDVGEFYVTVKQIFLNKQLVFDVDPAAQLSTILDLIGQSRVVSNIDGNTLIKFFPITQNLINNAGSRGIQLFTVYYGDEDQMPHPVQAAAMGFDNTPAYRGLISLACDNAPIHLYGNAIPQVEVVLTVWTRGETPDYIVYDPVWVEGVPVPAHTEHTGYRAVMQMLYSATYHPDTVYVLLTDNEELAASPAAIGRRSATTGEWEQASGSIDKVAILDYDGTGDGFIWQDYAAFVYHPPVGGKLYTYRYLGNFSGGSASTSYWTQIDDDYPFTFRKKSETPNDKGKTGVWDNLHSVTSNSNGSLVAGFHDGASGPDRARFSIWAPGDNVVAYFETNAAVFSGLWATDNLPLGILIDKNDHLWVFTTELGPLKTVNMVLAEFSVLVGVSDITLTHLNTYNLINLVGGVSSWRYFIVGATYNEVSDKIVFHWYCDFPSVGSPDPPDLFSGAGQARITHFDLATRTKKLSGADSILLTLSGGNLAPSIEEFGREGFLGTQANADAERLIGNWTQVDYTSYVTTTGNLATDGIHDGFCLVDTTTGIGTIYEQWPADLYVDTIAEDDPGIYSWTGVFFHPDTQCFWAVRRGEGFEMTPTDESGLQFLEETEGFGRYFINPGATATPYNLQQINEDIARRTGSLTVSDDEYEEQDTEFSALASIIPPGFGILNLGPARDAIEDLQRTFLYDIYETDWVLKAKLREGNSVVVTIDESEVLADGDQRHVIFKDNNEMELPRYLNLRFFSIERDHQTDIAPARIGGGSFNDRNALTLSTPVALLTTDTDDCPGAFTLASRMLRAGWAERGEASYSLPQRYLPYEVTDVKLITRDNLSFEVKCVSNGLGVNWAVEFGEVNHDSGTYSVTARGSVRDFTPPPQVKLVPQPIMVVIDTGMTTTLDNTMGHFITSIPSVPESQGGVWNGATLEKGSTSTAFSDYGFLPQSPIAGTAEEALADASPGVDTTNVLKLYVTSGTPKTTTLAAILADPTLNLVYTSTGELLQYAVSSKKAGGIYWLSTLLRGRFGTEQFTHLHEVDEAVVAFDRTKFLSNLHGEEELEAIRYWRARNSSIQQYSDTVTHEQRSRRLMPYAPAELVVSRSDSGDNIIVDFVRRSRKPPGTLLNDPDIYEDTEDYEADILTLSGGVVRTITTTASAGGSVITPGANRNVFYSLADQTTDWGGPLAEGGAEMELYQMSAQVGRGYPGRTTL